MRSAICARRVDRDPCSVPGLTMTLKDEIKRVFGFWIEWAEDAELLTLLDLIVTTLRDRGHRVTYEAQEGGPMKEDNI